MLKELWDEVKIWKKDRNSNLEKFRYFKN
jgi:hypothetical protein